MQDMVEIFKDESVMECAIKVCYAKFFGKRGAMINRGVLHRALFAFWSQFYDSGTVGEQQRVPVV